MRRNTKNVILIVFAFVVAIVVLFGIITATKGIVGNTPAPEENVQIFEPGEDTEEALGVVRRITEPSTGAITGYDVRGVVVAADVDENTITLSLSEEGEVALVLSLGNNTDIIGFLDKRSESSVREGFIEKNTYTSDTVADILTEITPGQTLLAHIPVWIETPEPSRCDTECVERVQALIQRGEEYIPELEDIIQTSVIETNTMFIISVLEIEN